MGTQLDTTWLWLLELKLRRTTGTAFQTFISDLMEARYGDDFIRTKPYGQLGDKGCDGYLNSTGCVYACYGAQNGAAGSVSSFIGKMKDDFQKAKTDLGDIMASWRMTHNIIEGLPTEAILAKKEFEAANPEITFSFFGKPSISEIMGELSDDQKEGFLGRQVRNDDYVNFQLSELKELVDAIVTSVAAAASPTLAIEPVSPRKIEFNKIPAEWGAILHSGRFNARHVEDYFLRHPIPTQGKQLATLFRNRYEGLAAQDLDPGTIMFELYAYVVGAEQGNVCRQVAAHTLLSYLFERCDIFENAPEESRAS